MIVQHLLLCSKTANGPLVGRLAERGLHNKLASIVAMASGFIFAHEAAVKDISRSAVKPSGWMCLREATVGIAACMLSSQ